LTVVGLVVASGFLCSLIAARAQSVTVRPLGRELPGLDRTQPGDSAPACESLWGAVPVLMFDRSGSTLIGPVHESLILFSDGLAIHARRGADIRDGGSVEMKNVSAGSAKALWQEVMAAGAASLCDDPAYVTDMPLTKVTVFTPAGFDSIAHTYAYYLAPAGAASQVELLIENFVETEFKPL